MGERGNIVLLDKNTDNKSGGSFPHPVYFYTHWSGYKLKSTLQAGLVRGKDRWNDPQYLSRVIFCQMIQAQKEDAFTAVTGFGITSRIGDSGYKLLVVQPDTKTVKELDSSDDLSAAVQRQWTYEQFVAVNFKEEED